MSRYSDWRMLSAPATLAPADPATREERRVLRALQALALGLPFLLGGRHSWTLALASPLVLVLLLVTLRARRRVSDAPDVPGLAALAAFVVLALVTTVPLPPWLLGALAPATARLYATVLSGWPASAEWSAWRPLAIDPYAVWIELNRFAIGLGAFAVVAAYPWRASGAVAGGDAREAVFGRLFLTLIAGGALQSALALVHQVSGSDRVLWITDAEALDDRVAGPFVNPNHFAAWLGMVIPAALAYLVALIARLHRRVRRAAGAGKGLGVQARRAWLSALIAHQPQLWTPLVVATGLVLMVAAHVGTGSRGGTAALLLGLALTLAGMVVTAARGRAVSVAWRLAPAVLVLALVLASGASLALWARAESTAASSGAVEAIDVGLGSRLAVAVAGRGIVRDHLWFGTGLGSWLHAFRPYQAPPVEAGIWDHAHNDYLELLAESGAAGAICLLLFALALGRAGAQPASAEDDDMPGRYPASTLAAERPPGFELPEWRAALAEYAWLRWGLAGGVATILVHGSVDFALRMPANLLALMLLLGLLVLSGPPPLPRNGRALAVLLTSCMLAAVPPFCNAARTAIGATPVAPADLLLAADLMVAEEGAVARPRALALVHRALDRAPADREAHEALATVLGPGPESEAALRRALVLEPWSTEVRDRLALALWERGALEDGAREIEEAMFRFPYLVSHAYLGATDFAAGRDPQHLLRALADGDSMLGRLAALEPAMAAAIERGLDRALAEAPAGVWRTAIADDLVTLLEARERWAEAAATLAAEAELTLDGSARLARAAADYLKADDQRAAEGMLLTALARAPEQGDLYRNLAVDVYAARGDFPSAEMVLQAGVRNALDRLPIYDGVTELLARRDAARLQALVQAVDLPRPARRRRAPTVEAPSEPTEESPPASAPTRSHHTDGAVAAERAALLEAETGSDTSAAEEMR